MNFSMPAGACVIDILKLVYVIIHIINLYIQIVLSSSLYPVGIPADMVSSEDEGKQITDGKAVKKELYFIQKNIN